MEHSDLVDFFHFNNVGINSLISIEHRNGNTIKARVANNNVIYEYDVSGNVINSHIEIINSTLIIDYSLDIVPVVLFSRDILSINKI